MKFIFFLVFIVNVNLCYSQSAKLFDFITAGQKMEVISKNRVAKETLTFHSPIDSLNKGAVVIRTYGRDGRETSSTNLMNNEVLKTTTYQYSSIYSKVRVCSTTPKDSIENCYDLVLSDDGNKLHRTLSNGFTTITYAVFKSPFNLDKDRKPLKSYKIVRTNSSLRDSLGVIDKSLVTKNKIDSILYLKYEFTYKEYKKNGREILQSKTNLWVNKKRERNGFQLNELKLEFDSSSKIMSFYVSKGKKEWSLYKVQYYDSNGLFFGKEIFGQERGYRLTENLFLQHGDRFKMVVSRDENGLANELKEYINDELQYITNYEYEYYD